MEFSFYANGTDPDHDARNKSASIPPRLPALIIRAQSTGGPKTGAELRYSFLPKTELPSEFQEINGPKSSHSLNIAYTMVRRSLCLES
ncbi:unnamed protein product [Macrosiphum euphorbiae]|uniref:Uncharacterized protein n=1 Tax=Macrosiphum euphorbiae TaxID=13131 RepID=A0AAV0XJW6_9HEMI|nr:unnamed protein product [Macrosiphum euphorbiae]